MSKLQLHNLFRMCCNIRDCLVPSLDGGCIGVAKAEAMAMQGGEKVVAARSNCDQPSYH